MPRAPTHCICASWESDRSRHLATETNTLGLRRVIWSFGSFGGREGAARKGGAVTVRLFELFGQTSGGPSAGLQVACPYCHTLYCHPPLNVTSSPATVPPLRMPYPALRITFRAVITGGCQYGRAACTRFKYELWCVVLCWVDTIFRFVPVEHVCYNCWNNIIVRCDAPGAKGGVERWALLRADPRVEDLRQLWHRHRQCGLLDTQKRVHGCNSLRAELPVGAHQVLHAYKHVRHLRPFSNCGPRKAARQFRLGLDINGVREESAGELNPLESDEMA
eukprot:9466829-Pyramimonas_sp.AAC.1